MDSAVLENFGSKIRLRACGLVFEGEKMLLVNHKGLYGHDFWAPPGGGVVFGETVEKAIKREFMEECQVEVEIGLFLFGCEFVKPPLHAVELFYEVKLLNQPTLGTDPELNDKQIISELRFMGTEDLMNLDYKQLHGIFAQSRNPSAISQIRGFFSLA